VGVINYSIGVSASIGPIKIENCLLTYSLTSFAVPLFTFANGVVYVQK